MDTTSERLRSSLGAAPELRVISNGRVLVLERPLIGIDGISYGRAKGYPRPRPALITSEWEKPVPPANPLPWSEIAGVERPVTRISPVGVMLGFGLGFMAGRVLRWPATYGALSLSPYAGVATWYLFPLATGALGAVAMGRFQEWERVYTSPGHPER